MKKIIIYLALLLLAGTVQAQNKPEKKQKSKKQPTVTLGCTVADAFTKVTIRDATVTAMTQDSVVVAQTSIESWGINRLDVPKKELDLIIRAEKEGYEPACINYKVNPRGRHYYQDVPTIRIRKKAEGDDIAMAGTLDEVVVKGTLIKMAYRGDTLVYNAEAFKLPDGSMLDGLVKQLPGAELTAKGDILINGRKIDYLMLNGKDFFKGDNKVMLDNLPYFTVKELKVYEQDTERSRMAGRTIEKREYVMDVSLKREYARSYVANIEGGVGTDKRYTGRVFGLYYDDMWRSTFFADMNNINEESGVDGRGEWSPRMAENGVQSIKSIGTGIQYTGKENKIRNSIEAKVAWKDTDRESRTVTERFSPGGNIFGESNSLSRAKDLNADVKGRFVHQKLMLTGIYSLNYTRGKNFGSANDSTRTTSLINRTLNEWSNNNENYTLIGMLGKYTKLPWGDGFLIDLSGSYVKMKPHDAFKFTRTDFATENRQDLRNLCTNTRLDKYNYLVSSQYSFMLPDNFNLNITNGYRQSGNSGATGNYRLDWLSDDEMPKPGQLPSSYETLMKTFDTVNSYSYNKLERTYRGNIELMQVDDHKYFGLNIPVNVQNDRLTFHQNTLDTVARRTNVYFTPNMYYNYNKGSRHINLNYNGSYDLVDFISLMPVYDDTNPLSKRINNPKLKNSTHHTVTFDFSQRRDSVDMTYGGGLNFTIGHNDRGTRTTYNSATGAYTYINDNVNGNWNGSIRGFMNGTLDRNRRWRYSLGAGVSYNHSVDFGIAYDTESTILSKVNTLNVNMNGLFGYSKGPLEITVDGKVDTRNSRSDRENFENINAVDYQYSGTLQYKIPLIDLTLNSKITMYSRRGYSTEMMNTDDLVWNVQLTRSFMKGCLTAKVMAIDLLHNISSKQYAVNAQGRTETWNRAVPHYILCSLAYRLTKKAKGK